MAGVTSAPMSDERQQDLRDLAEQAWRGELDLQFEHHPVHRYYPGACRLADGLLGFKGIAGFYVIDSGDGLVMLDAGHLLDVKRCFEEVRREWPDTPVVAAIYSHHHVDHVFSVTAFDAEADERGWTRPTVYAHERVPAHFDRYLSTLGWNTAINRRQFAIDAPHYRWPESYRYPDVLYRRNLTFRRGDLTFELTHGRGETDDVTWTWIPERRILHTGDLFIWAVPNAGNPQKVQRYVGDWADSLERMLPLGAEILLPGHGLPILGADRVRRALDGTARYMRSIEEQSVAAMNRGLSLDQVVQAVTPPADLADEPYLQPVYDDPSFLVRMVWRRYGGWWDGEFDSVVPATKREQAEAWVELAGGVERVVERALASSAAGRHAVACHLIEAARHAAPESAEVHETRAAVYRANAESQPSSMARNILNHAALASDQGRRDLASDD